MSQFDKILNDLYHINNPFYVKVQEDIENLIETHSHSVWAQSEGVSSFMNLSLSKKS